MMGYRVVLVDLPEDRGLVVDNRGLRKACWPRARSANDRLAQHLQDRRAMNQARLERLIDDAASGRKYGLRRAMNSSRVNCSGMLPRCACNTRTRLASLGAPSISSTFQTPWPPFPRFCLM